MTPCPDRLALLTVCALALAVPSPARAQTTPPPPAGYQDPIPTTPLARVIPVAIADGARNSNFRTPDDHRLHFVVGTDLSPVPAALNTAIAMQLTMFPIATSWGGRLDDSKTGSTTGPVSRSSFAERAVTLGKGVFAFGFGTQSLHYSAIDGVDVEDGEMRMYFEHNNCCAPGPVNGGEPGNGVPPFERDLLEESVSVDIDRNVYAFALGYGLSDRFDVGLTVPITKVNLRTRVNSRILRVATAAQPNIHKFDALELAHATTYASGTAQGIGDLVVNAKFRFVSSEDGGLAAVFNVQLPTGDELDLLGTGATRAEGRIVWSDQFGRIGAHLNAGYTYSSGDLPAELVQPGDPNAVAANRPPADLSLFDEIGVVGGIEVALAPRVGISGDIVARQLRDVPRFGTTTGPGGSAGLSFVPPAFEFLGRGSVTQLLGVIGFRVHLGRPLLVSADVLLPLTDDGLTPKSGVVVGMSLAF